MAHQAPQERLETGPGARCVWRPWWCLGDQGTFDLWDFTFEKTVYPLVLFLYILVDFFHQLHFCTFFSPSAEWHIALRIHTFHKIMQYILIKIGVGSRSNVSIESWSRPCTFCGYWSLHLDLILDRQIRIKAWPVGGFLRFCQNGEHLSLLEKHKEMVSVRVCIMCGCGCWAGSYFSGVLGWFWHSHADFFWLNVPSWKLN